MTQLAPSPLAAFFASEQPHRRPWRRHVRDYDPAAACAHDPAQYVTSDEGTSYCPACEAEALAAGPAETIQHWRWNGLWRRGAGTPDDPNNGRLVFRLTGINAYLYCRHFDTRTATLRGLYWWLVRRYETELCQHCGRPVRIVYHAPDDLWELATGCARRPDGESAPGILCPACLDALVELRIAGHLSWTCARAVRSD